MQKLIDNLKSDPDMAQKADNIKARLKNDETFNHYLGEVWGDLRGWVKTISAATTHVFKQRIAEAGQWFGETLLRDDALRESLNEHRSRRRTGWRRSSPPSSPAISATQ